MDNFTFHIPTRFVFGKDAELQTGKKLKELGFNSVLIVYGQGSVVRSGLLDRVKQSLKESDIQALEIGGVVPNPVDGPVYEGIRMGREAGIDCVLGLGGASALDTAKAIAIGIPYEGDFWDFYSGKEKVKKALPIVSVLTISAAGSESSNSSVITKESVMLKRGLNTEFIRPQLAMLNPELTFTVPAIQKAYGIADMMAHIFERYFTNTQDVLLTDELCEAVLRTVMKSGPKALFNPQDYSAHADIMWASTLAHNDTLAVGRQQDWSSHGIAHGISARFSAPHGAALAVLFPFWMQHQLEHDVERFYRFAVKVMGLNESENHKETALEGIQKLRSFFDSLGLPHSLKTFGVKAEDLPQLLEDVKYKADGTIGFFKPLTKEDVLSIYKAALE
ncbi:MAG: iron-containing alcohol dehydrogenase [Eubacteriales bacterium]|nr:iron-containing alcohol dehydrogenase [Eubacteriales bacterium]